MITGYTRESGVRQLERELGKLGRKVARKIAAREVDRVDVDADKVHELLGRPKVHPERANREDQVGVATGMYYTPMGGDIMFVEASTMKGKGDLVLTGQLGDVMKESARAAWSYARSHAESLGIPPECFDRDLHVHVPAGAIPKDGPSAGVAMATAMVSALSGRKARHDLAMTGEITLSGRVLPIGGVKEKVLGAVRAGITEILLPKDNEADLDDLPQEVRDTPEDPLRGGPGRRPRPHPPGCHLPRGTPHLRGAARGRHLHQHPALSRTLTSTGSVSTAAVPSRDGGVFLSGSFQGIQPPPAPMQPGTPKPKVTQWEVLRVAPSEQ